MSDDRRFEAALRIYTAPLNYDGTSDSAQAVRRADMLLAELEKEPYVETIVDLRPPEPLEEGVAVIETGVGKIYRPTPPMPEVVELLLQGVREARGYLNAELCQELAAHAQERAVTLHTSLDALIKRVESMREMQQELNDALRAQLERQMDDRPVFATKPSFGCPSGGGRPHRCYCTAREVCSWCVDCPSCRAGREKRTAEEAERSRYREVGQIDREDC